MTTSSLGIHDTQSGKQPWWTPPEASGLVNVYASSFLDGFINDHTYLDMVTELIQNEFDADGSRVEIHLTDRQLQVTGNGRVIDSNGWKRLGVVLGTGIAAGLGGSKELIPPKKSLIGSKIFGLRSLFKVGDRINIGSGGRYMAKDRFEGSSPSPIRDPYTKDRPGALISVPYRESVGGILQPFTEEHEQEMLDGLLDHFQYCAVKLAMPDSKKGLTEIEVISERLNRRIVWNQNAGRVQASAGMKEVIQREVQARVGTLDSLPKKKYFSKRLSSGKPYRFQTVSTIRRFQNTFSRETDECGLGSP